MRLPHLSIVLLFISVGCYADNCKMGPLYSCQSLDKAKECESYSQCITLWKHNNAVSYAGASFKYNCQFCQVLMQDLKQLLQNNVTESEIVKIVDELCLKLPTPNGKEMCAIMTNLYLKTALDMLAADIDAPVICRSMHMCNGSAYLPKEPKELLKMHFTRSNALFRLRTNFANTSNYCPDCMVFLKDVQQHFKVPASRDSVKAYLIQTICHHLPHELQAACNETVDLYADKVLIMLSGNWDVNQMCNTLNFCHTIPKKYLLRKAVFALLTPHLDQLPRRFTDNQCDICQSLVNNAKAQLNQPNAQKAIETLLKEQFCAQLAAITQECDYYVELYLPILLSVLSEDVDTLEVCRYLNACPPPGRLALPPFMIKKPFVVLDANNQSRLQLTPLVKSNTGSCSFCLLVVKLVEQNLDANRSKEAIKHYLNEICNVAGQEKDNCLALVNQYGDIILNLLLQFSSPEIICRTIGVCSTSQQRLQNRPLLFEPNSNAMSPEFRRTCILYVRKAQLLQRASNSTMSAQSMQKALAQLCVDDLKSPSSQRECQTIVARHVATLMIALKQNRVVPERFCRDIAKSSSSPPLLGARKCTWGPAYWCSSLTNAQQCNALQHCQARVWQIKPLARQVQNETSSKVGSSSCDLCKMLADQAFNYLKQNKTEDELESLLESVCNYLPQSQQEVCRDLVKQYLPTIVNALENGFTPDQLCQALDLCPKSARFEGRLLGRNPCTRGPSYWCQSVSTASQCQTLFHCQEKVWKARGPPQLPKH